AGRLSTAAREQPDQEEAWSTQGEEPCRHRAAHGRARAGTDPVPVSPVLPADQEPPRRPGGDHGPGAPSGRAGRTRSGGRAGIRAAIAGGIRAEVAGATGAVATSQGGVARLRPGSAGGGDTILSTGRRPRPGGWPWTVATRVTSAPVCRRRGSGGCLDSTAE